MSIIKKTGSITALLACLSYGSVNSAYAAQLDFQDPFKGETPAQPAPAEVDSELCEEETAPESQLNSLNLGPNLVASAVASDTPLGLEGQTLVAQAVCDLGGVAPEGGGSLGGGFPLGLLAIPAAGGIIAAVASGGGDDDTQPVPEPAELATASLFATLGVAGILLRRKNKSGEED